MKNILVIAAHPDDELLGEGGTIRKLANQGLCCRAVIIGEGLTSRRDNRASIDLKDIEELRRDCKTASEKIGYISIDFCGLPDNRLDNLDLLDVVKIIEKYIDKYCPDTIFTHHYGDLNVDHQIICKATLTACRPVGTYAVERIYSFETPSSTEWDYTYEAPFVPNVYFDITDTLAAKMEGMNCYRSESAYFPHPRSGEALQALAKYRGSNIGVKAAEAFMLIREVVR